MYRYSLTLHRESALREVADVYYIEVANGIYHVDKDRHCIYSEYVDLRTVTGALNARTRILVRTLNGSIFSNTDLVQHLDK